MSTTKPRASFMTNATRAAAAVAFVLTLFACAESGHTPAPTSATIPTAPSSSTTPAGDPSEEESPLVALAPGTQSAPSFWPSLTFSVPSGWLTERAAEGFVALVPDTAENRARSREGGSPVTFLNVFPNITVAAENCEEAAEPGVGPAASEIVSALATRPGLSTVGPVAVTIGGLSGQRIDLSIAPDWTASCPQSGTPFVPLIYSSDFLWWGAEPGERFRIIVLDVAGLPSGMYATVTIFIYSAEAAAWDDHLSASTAVVDSFEFDTTPPRP